MTEDKEPKQRRYKGKVVEPKPELSLSEKIASAEARVKNLETQLSNKLSELEDLRDEEILLRGGPEDFQYTHRQFLNRCVEEAQKEAITNEQAIAHIKQVAKMSPIDRAFAEKRGWGGGRPVYPVKGNK